MIWGVALPGVVLLEFESAMEQHATSARDRGIESPDSMRLLLVEDDDRTAEHVASSLSEAGWHIDRATEGEDGYARAIATHYDVLVIDRMLPRLDGLALVRALRAAGRQTPALFLTTMSGIDDRIEGLEAGGDDYLVKPFAHGELVARVRALVRRSRIGVDACKLRLADLEVDTLGRRVRRAGQDIELQPREFELLEYLLRHAGDVVTRKQLLETVWNFHFVPQTNIVESHMSRLRSKLDRGFDRRLIETVRGVGYVLRDPVS